MSPTANYNSLSSNDTSLEDRSPSLSSSTRYNFQDTGTQTLSTGDIVVTKIYFNDTVSEN